MTEASHWTSSEPAPRDEDGFQQVLGTLRARGLRECAEQLHELHTLEDLEGGAALSLEASRGFASFMEKWSMPNEPVLGLFQRGTLSAGWRIARNQHLLLEFLDQKAMRFAMIEPDTTAPDKRFHLNGQGSQDSVIKTLCERGVTYWRKA